MLADPLWNGASGAPIASDASGHVIGMVTYSPGTPGVHPTGIPVETVAIGVTLIHQLLSHVAPQMDDSDRKNEAIVFAPAVRAALDLASAPPREHAAVVAAVKKQYAVPVKPSDDPRVPFLPIPQIVAVTEDVDEQLRIFRNTARSN